MSKSAMLRTRRRDVNVKPNRRLDRKSSRGMIYENEELRLRTININAEIERGQSDIKKLRRENEQLRKEIWCLRDEYEKLDKLLKEKGDRTSCSSCSSDTDSCTSCSESEDNETTQNIENVQKTTLNNLRTDFDHLSVVTEETSAENSDKNSNNASSPKQSVWDALPPDQSYPNSQTLPLPTTKSSLVTEQMPKHFFAPLKPSKSYENCQEDSCWKSNSSSWMQQTNFDQKPPILTPRTNLQNMLSLPPPPPLYDPNFLPPIPPKLALCARTNPDILVKTEPNFSQESTTNSFINGGNLDELLQDIQTISNDILQISAQHESKGFEGFEEDKNSAERPYKSELNVVLMPKSMPLLGFDKYQNIKSSLESLASIKKSVESLQMLDVPHTEINIPPPQNFTPFPTDFPTISRPLTPIPPPKIHQDLDRQSSNPFFFNSLDNYNNDRFKPESFAHDNFGFKNEIIQPNKPEEKVIKSNIDNEIVENKNKPDKEVKQSENEKKEPDKSPKSRRTRKVSIYFKGKKDKLARSLSLDTKMAQETPKSFDKTPITTPNLKNSSGESKTSLNQEASEKINSDTNKTSSDSKGSNYDRKHRKSSSTSPERKHVHIKPENEKKCNKKRHRKSDRRPATRRASLDRSFSVCTDRSNILDNKFGHFEDYTNSERDRSNSLSSCDTIKSRKMSAPPQFQVSGKIPWFGCWGNGCL